MAAATPDKTARSAKMDKYADKDTVANEKGARFAAVSPAAKDFVENLRALLKDNIVDDAFITEYAAFLTAEADKVKAYLDCSATDQKPFMASIIRGTSLGTPTAAAAAGGRPTPSSSAKKATQKKDMTVDAMLALLKASGITAKKDIGAEQLWTYCERLGVENFEGEWRLTASPEEIELVKGEVGAWNKAYAKAAKRPEEERKANPNKKVADAALAEYLANRAAGGPAPAAEDVEDEVAEEQVSEHYEVFGILDWRPAGKTVEFLVKWAEPYHGSKYDEWKPYEDLVGSKETIYYFCRTNGLELRANTDSYSIRPLPDRLPDAAIIPFYTSQTTAMMANEARQPESDPR